MSRKKWLVTMAAAAALSATGYAVQAEDIYHDNLSVLGDDQGITFTDEGTGTAIWDIHGRDITIDIENSGGGFSADPISFDWSDGGTIKYTEIVNNKDSKGQNKTIKIRLKNTIPNAFGGVAGVIVPEMNNAIINSNLDIDVESDYAAAGLDLDKGIGEGNQQSITVNGDVKMRRSDPKDPWAIRTNNVHGNYGPGGAVSGADNYTGARWQPSGISASAANDSFITVNGNVDLAVRGTAVKTDPFYNDSVTLTLKGGNVTIDTPKDKTESFYSVANYGGTININAENGSPYTKNTVKITGNMIGFDHFEAPYFYAAGKTNIGLVNDQSFWRGVMDNAGYNANTTLWLQNGAQWYHESLSRTNGMQPENMPSPSNEGHYKKYDGISHITTVKGGSDDAHKGFIYQKENIPIHIENYSGHVTLAYDHDSSLQAIGGDVHIAHAAEGSAVTVVTDRTNLPDGFTASASAENWNTVSQMMSNLASKLYYEGKDGKLAGRVGIAEGLTASSQLLRAGDIQFKDNGQGSYTAEDKPTGPVIPDSQTDAEFTETITGVKARDQKYVDTGVLKEDGKYIFTKDTTFTTPSAVSIGSAPQPVEIHAEGKTLTFNSNGTTENYVLNLTSEKGITINAKELKIRDTNHDKRTEAFRIGGQGGTNTDAYKITINSDVDMLVDGTEYSLGFYAAGNMETTVNGNVSAMGDETHKWGLTSINGAYGYYGVSLIYSGSSYSIQTGPKVTINGDVNAKIDGNALFANGGKARLTINGGGNIEINKDNTHNYYAMLAESATTSMNVNLDDSYHALSARDNDLVLKGNISASTGAVNANEPETLSRVNLGLATDKSEWTGIAYNKFPDAGKKAGDKTFTGEINVFLQNGATWNNEEWGAVETKAWGGAEFKGSHLTTLAGGESAAKAGIINQNDTRDITVDNYSGNTTVIYKHDETDPTKMIGGDFKIAHAAENSGITLLTDNKGGLTEDSSNLNDVLNALANKLYYTDYKDGHLSGIVKVAEGLTASSAEIKTGDITFSDGTNGSKTEGQGFYEAPKAPVIPDSQTLTEFTDTITGVKGNDQAYVNDGVLKDDGEHYVFTKDTTIKADASINIGEVGHAVDINAKDHTLNITSMSANTSKGVTITADKLNIQKTAGGRIEGIHVGGQGGTNTDPYKVTINGDVDMNIRGGDYTLGLYAAGRADITINGNVNAMGNAQNQWGISSENGAFGYYGVSLLYSGSNYGQQSGSKITVNGDINAKIDGNALFSNGGNARFTVNGGGNIEINKDNTHKYYVMLAESSILSMNVNVDDNYKATSAQDHKLIMKGNITASTGAVNGNEPGLESVVNLGLATKDSEWTGVAYNKFPEGGKKSGGKTFTGAINVFLQNGATWNNEEWGAVETKAWGGAEFKGSHLTTLAGGESAAKAGIINQNDTRDITVDNYSGHTTVIYKHDETDPTKMIGGDFKITHAAENSGITLLTDNKGGLTKDSSNLNDVLNALANKLYYTDYKDGHLSGIVKVAEGLTASSAAIKTGDVTFSDGTNGSKTEGQGFYDAQNQPDKPDQPDQPDKPDQPDTPKGDIHVEYGSEETRMMKGTKSALFGSTIMWRSNNNDLQRRMGDLRLGQEETGVWARYVGGRNKFDRQNTYLSQDYDVLQVGFDKKLGDWTVGAALDHGKGKAKYTGGKGEEKMNTFAIYGSRVSDDGKYLDIILKSGQVKNEFNVSNEMGNRLNADYKTWGNSLSVEYGKRFKQDNGFYLDPSVEFTMGRLNGKNFRGTSDLGTLYVRQHAFNSAIGRIGFSVGKETEKSNLFAKFALAHEFGGNFRTDFYAADGGLKSTKIDLSDTWIDFEAGGSIRVSKDVYIYGTYTRTFAADMATKWRTDIGVRYSF